MSERGTSAASTDDAAWARFAASRPRRGSRLVARPGEDRDGPHVMVRNEASGAHVRIDPLLWRIVDACDGRRTLTDVLHAIDLADPVSRTYLVAGLTRLERHGIVALGLPGAAARLARWQVEHRRRVARSLPTRLLGLRFPLHDPDRWLQRLAPYVGRVRARTGAWLLALLTLACLAVVLTDGAALVREAGAFASHPSRWWLLALAWPIAKALHELAHALAVLRVGGHVHEVGFGFLVLMPVPYVDASDASLFERRRDRVLVGAAGMLAEGALAGVALLLWWALEPGLLREFCFALVISGTLVTVAFNANPLLRFDGYFILQDLLALPNLATRAGAWWRALAVRLVAGPHVAGPARETDPRTVRWLAGYGLLATAYRYVIVIGIVVWLLDTVPLLGGALAGLAIWPLGVRPIVRAVRWLACADALAGRRGVAVRRSVGATAGVLLGVALVPLPSSTRIEGIVGVAGTGDVVAPASGELAALPPAQARVSAGDLLARLDAPELSLEAARLRAERARLGAERALANGRDALEARLLGEDLDRLQRQLDDVETRLASLRVEAPRDGRFVPTAERAVPGRWVHRGETLGQLVDGSPLRVRAVLGEHRLARVNDGVRSVTVRLAEAPAERLAGRWLDQVPAADRELPSVALADAPGMTVATVDGRLETLEPVFHVEIGLPADATVAGLGGRAYVTLRHPPEPLASRWWRTTRQLFLERLPV